MSTAPTLNVDLTPNDRRSTAKSMTFDDLELDGESGVRQAEKEAENREEMKPAEGPGSRMPAPEKFAHTSESCHYDVGDD